MTGRVTITTLREAQLTIITRAATLVVGVAVVLLAAGSLAPVAGAQTRPLARAWTVQPSPNPKGAFASGLQAVSCPGPGRCVAVGSSSYPSGHQVAIQHVLIEQLSDGTWALGSTPAISGARSSVLTGVSCPVTAFCVAIGSVQFTAAHRPPGLLAETWNGTSWSHQILPAPPGGSLPSLFAVSCAAKGACVAVGSYVDNKSGTYRPLAERLNGSAWSVLPTPVPPHGGGATDASEFTGVDCPTATLCEAVGDVDYNDTLQAVFAYRLTGSTWTYQRQVNPGPDPGDADAAVSCSGADACTSAGFVAVIGEQALAEHWDGATWVRQVTPAPGAPARYRAQWRLLSRRLVLRGRRGVLACQPEERAPHRPPGHGRGVEREGLVSVAAGGPDRRDRRAQRDLVPVAHRVHRGRRRIHGVQRSHPRRGVHGLMSGGRAHASRAARSHP